MFGSVKDFQPVVQDIIRVYETMCGLKGIDLSDIYTERSQRAV